MGGQESKNGKASRSRGLDLLRKVYAELYAELSDTFTPAELLRAAQALIDVSSDEYSLKKYADSVRHPGYYSHDVDRMISESPWWLLSHELRCDNLGDERFNLNANVRQRLKDLYNPDSYDYRG
jgi:hypothetical protein